MLQSGLFQIEQDIPWEDLGNGIKRQIFGYDDRIMLVKAKFEAEVVGTLHQHITRRSLMWKVVYLK